jgi:hypothetical protein
LTSLKQETQQQLSATLAAEINGFAASGSFNAAFSEAQQNENDRAEVEINFYQAAGSGASASVTLNVKDILTRLNNFTTAAATIRFRSRRKLQLTTRSRFPCLPPLKMRISSLA